MRAKTEDGESKNVLYRRAVSSGAMKVRCGAQPKSENTNRRAHKGVR